MNISNKTKFTTLIIALATIIAIITTTITFGLIAKSNRISQQTTVADDDPISGFEIASQDNLISFINSSTNSIGIVVADFTVNLNATSLVLPEGKSLMGRSSAGTNNTITVEGLTQSVTVTQIQGDLYSEEVVGKTASGGLFSINNGSISDLNIILNANYTSSAAGLIGGVVGFNGQSGNLTNVNVRFADNTTVSDSTSYFGGIVGYNYGIIANIEATIGAVSLNKNINYGGVAGGNASNINNTKINFNGNVSLSSTATKFGGVAGVNEKNGIIYYTTIKNEQDSAFATDSAQCVGNNKDAIINGVVIDAQANTKMNYKVVGTNVTTSNVKNIYILTASDSLIDNSLLGGSELFAKQIVTYGKVNATFSYNNYSLDQNNVSYILDVVLKDDFASGNTVVYGARALWYDNENGLVQTTYADRTSNEIALDDKYNVTIDSVNDNKSFTKIINNDAYNNYYKYQILIAKKVELANPILNATYSYKSNIMSDFTNELTTTTGEALHKENLAFYGERDGLSVRMDTPGEYSNIKVANEKFKYATVLDCTDFADIYNHKSLRGNDFTDVFIVPKKDFGTSIGSQGKIIINQITLTGTTMNLFNTNINHTLLTGPSANEVDSYKIASTNGEVKLVSKVEYPQLFTNNSIKFDAKLLNIPSTDITGSTYYVTALDSNRSEISNTVILALKIDNEAPTLSLVTDLSENKWYNSSQNIEFTVSDRQSIGYNDISVSYTFSATESHNNNWTDISPMQGIFTFSLTEGDNYYFIKVADSVGNSRIFTYRLKMDNVYPSYSLKNSDGTTLNNEIIPINQGLRIQFDPNNMTSERLDSINSYILFNNGSEEYKITINKLSLNAANNYMYFNFNPPFVGNVICDVNVVTRSGLVNSTRYTLSVTKQKVIIAADDLIVPSDKSKLTKKYDGSNIFEEYDGVKYSTNAQIKWSTENTFIQNIKFRVTFPNAKAVGELQNLKFEIVDDRFEIEFLPNAEDAINAKLKGAKITAINLKLKFKESNYQYIYTGSKILINPDEYKFTLIDVDDDYINYDYLIPELSSAIGIDVANKNIQNAGELSFLYFQIDINKLQDTLAYDRESGKYLINISDITSDGKVNTDTSITISAKTLDVSIDFNSVNLVYTGEEQQLKLNFNELSESELATIQIKYSKDNNSNLTGFNDAGEYYVWLISTDNNYQVDSSRTRVVYSQKQIQANINGVSNNNSNSAINIEYTGSVVDLSIDFAVSTIILDTDFSEANISIKLDGIQTNLYNSTDYSIDFTKLSEDLQPKEIAQYTLSIEIANTNNVKGLNKEIIFKITPTTYKSLDYQLEFNYSGEENKFDVKGYPSSITHVCYFSKEYWDTNAEHYCSCEGADTNGQIVSVNTNHEILFVVIDWKENNDSEAKLPYVHISAGKYTYKVSFYNYYFIDAENINMNFKVNAADAPVLYDEFVDTEEQYVFNGGNNFKLASYDTSLNNNDSSVEINNVYYWKPTKTLTETQINNMTRFANNDEVFTDAQPDKVYEAANFDASYKNAGTYIYRYFVEGNSIKGGDEGTYFIRRLTVKRAQFIKENLSVDELTKTFDGKPLNMSDIVGKTHWGPYATDNEEGSVFPSFMLAGEEIIDADPENPYDVVYTFSALNYEDISITQAFTILPKPVTVNVISMKNEVRIKSNMKKLQDMLAFEATFDDPTIPVDEEGIKEEVEVSLNFDEVDTSKPGVYQVTIELDNENYIVTNDPIEITLLKQITLTSIIIIIACILAVFALGGICIKLYMKKNQIKL